MLVRYQFFIKPKVSGTLPPGPAIHLRVLCSTTTQTGATGFKTGTHVYFVKGPSPTAGDPDLSTRKFVFLMTSSLFYSGLD